MNVCYLSAAQSELQEAIDYYNKQRPGLGFEFSDEIRSTIARVENYPLAWTPFIQAHTPLPGSSISLQHYLRDASRPAHHCCHPASPS